MKLLYKISLFALITLFTFSCSTDDSIDDNTDDLEVDFVTPDIKSIEIEILERINDHRVSMGLNALDAMAVVKSIAYSHTDYMVDNNKVSHDNFFTRSDYLKTNVGAIRVSENVAYGYTSAESVVNAWIKSEGHKANLEGDFSNFDISAEKNEAGKWYYTNIFIKK